MTAEYDPRREGIDLRRWLRDAAGAWGAAFSPSECLGYFGLADDEPFGPDWRTIDDGAAKRLLSEPDAPATLDHVAYTLGVKAAPVSLPALTPATKLVVAGGAAIVAVAKAFAASSRAVCSSPGS